MKADVINQLKDLYNQIDRQTAALQATTGLQCPPGCGYCCLNPEVETTVLEMLPLAMELWNNGRGIQLLERVDDLNSSICLFYESDPSIALNGRCSVYSLRPTVCRLFGFATTNNKQGLPELAVCVRHKETQPEVVQLAQKMIAEGLPAPNFSRVALQVEMLDPSWSQRLPINQAFKLAFERVSLIAQLISDSEPNLI